MDSQPNLIDLNTDLSCEPIAIQTNNDIDHQYVNYNGSESNKFLNDKEDTYSIFGAECLLNSNNNNNNNNNYYYYYYYY
jgi:hypothetical protein